MKERHKIWTVIWTKKGRKEYLVPNESNGIIPMDNNELEFNVNRHRRGRPKMRYATIYPFFSTRKEAEAYRDGNSDWEVVSFIFNL